MCPLVMLSLCLCLGYYHRINALVISENITDILSEMTIDNGERWTQYIKMVNEWQTNVLLNYPRPDKGTGRYPPPQGSDIVPHPDFPQLLTMETHVQVWVVIDSFVRWVVPGFCLNSLWYINNFSYSKRIRINICSKDVNYPQIMQDKNCINLYILDLDSSNLHFHDFVTVKIVNDKLKVIVFLS